MPTPTDTDTLFDEMNKYKHAIFKGLTDNIGDDYVNVPTLVVALGVIVGTIFSTYQDSGQEAFDGWVDATRASMNSLRRDRGFQSIIQQFHATNGAAEIKH